MIILIFLSLGPKFIICILQNVKENAGSVRLVRDEAQPEQLLPDVYLNIAIPARPAVSLQIIFQTTEIDPFNFQSPEQDPNMIPDEPRERRNSGFKSKFRPVLEPVMEMAEAVC